MCWRRSLESVDMSGNFCGQTGPKLSRNLTPFQDGALLFGGMNLPQMQRWRREGCGIMVYSPKLSYWRSSIWNSPIDLHAWKRVVPQLHYPPLNLPLLPQNHFTSSLHLVIVLHGAARGDRIQRDDDGHWFCYIRHCSLQFKAFRGTQKHMIY